MRDKGNGVQNEGTKPTKTNGEYNTLKNPYVIVFFVRLRLPRFFVVNSGISVLSRLGTRHRPGGGAEDQQVCRHDWRRADQ